MEREKTVDKQHETNYIDELAEPYEADSISQLEAMAKNYAIGQAAVEELKVLKPILARAISQLPKRQLKLSITQQTTDLSEWELQAKTESASGALVFRAVKA